MKHRRFGTEKSVSEISLGCSKIGSLGNPAPMRQVRATLEAAIEAGITLFDTANIYGQGDSEREIARAVAGLSERPLIVTKVGQHFSSKMRLLRPLKPILRPLLSASAAARGTIRDQRKTNVGFDFAPEQMRREVDGSRRRLGMDRLDVLLLHSPPAELLTAEVWDEVLRLRSEGKAAMIGVSCDDVACLELAASLPGLEVIQLSLATASTPAGSALLRRLAERQVAIMLREIFERTETPRTQLLKKALAVPDVSTVVIGTTNPAHLIELANATAG